MVGLGFVAVVLRSYGLSDWSFSAREALVYRAITLPIGAGDELGGGVRDAAPLVHGFLRWLLEAGLLPSQGEGWLRLPFALAGALAVPGLYLLARPVVGGTAALLAATLLAIHPAAIAASQTMGAPSLVLLSGLWALGAGRWRPLALSAALLLAALAGPAGWLLVAVAAASLVPGSSRPRFAAAVQALAVPFLIAHLPAWSWPVVVLAVVGAALAPAAMAPWRLLAAAAVVAFGAAGLVGLVDGLDATVALPLLLLFAATGGVALAERVCSALAVGGVPRLLAAGLPLLLTATWLALDTWLYAAVYEGSRPAWRDAADVVLRQRVAAGDCAVGAAAGALPLLCYLRPNHWRERTRDPHPGLEVVPLPAADLAAAIDRLAASPRRQVLLVLGDAELRALDGVAAAALRGSFAPADVVSRPGRGGNETLHVYARAASR